ncbi:MAG: penicillin acylase family protein [Verrucomicrobiales bacterium]|nr:penicillin acylase family protein [Verrucomicrobiales bacterium]
MNLRRVARILAWLAASLITIAAAMALGAWATLRASLPQLEGKAGISGLSAPVDIARDDHGVPTIVASNRVDAARAMGFLHAQERFFQMDLLRRQSAGELAELFGPGLVNIDQSYRLHRLRQSARNALDRLPAHHRAVLAAYTAGVNAGLSSLTARPPEYLLLRQTPQPWREEDSLLVGFTMYLTLQDSSGREERDRYAVLKELPPAAAKFFFPEFTQWDAPIDDTAAPVPPVPGPEILDLRSAPVASTSARRNRFVTLSEVHQRRIEYERRLESAPAVPFEPRLKPGSNSWGVPGSDTPDGAAIVANDMHLDLGIPNIWFRMQMKWRATEPGADQEFHEWIGVTLPGVPAMIVGSNRQIAWGFTNATIDTSDLVELEFDPQDPNRYRTPDGWKSVEWTEELIRVQGGPPRAFPIAGTVWGPIPNSTSNAPGRFALRWIAHVPGAIDLRLLDLETARSVDEALAIAAVCGTPVQNFLVGDRQGKLAWSLIGPLPQRVGFSGESPVSWADGRCRWDGFRAPAQRPGPFPTTEQHRLWTANNRILGTPAYLSAGAWSTDLGARARQIRDDLRGLPRPVRETDLMSIHRDDRAAFLDRWQKRLLDSVRQAPDPVVPQTQKAALIRLLENWQGRASVDSVGYRLTRSFRYQVHRRVMDPLVTRCRQTHPGMGEINDRNEDAVWRLLEEQPVHLLNPRFSSYQAIELDALKEVIDSVTSDSRPLEQATWGARNTLRLHHPISRAVPALERWLDLPSRPLPGDDNMPRVQGPQFGASERLVVSPGHEEQGLFHMPGGQSGHFLSPYYSAGHDDWCEVKPTSLMPSPARHHLTLTSSP